MSFMFSFETESEFDRAINSKIDSRFKQLYNLNNINNIIQNESSEQQRTLRNVSDSLRRDLRGAYTGMHSELLEQKNICLQGIRTSAAAHSGRMTDAIDEKVRLLESKHGLEEVKNRYLQVQNRFNGKVEFAINDIDSSVLNLKQQAEQRIKIKEDNLQRKYQQLELDLNQKFKTNEEQLEKRLRNASSGVFGLGLFALTLGTFVGYHSKK